MIPVFPYDIRRSKDGCDGELLLRLGGGSEAFIIHLSLEQARLLAVEMRGLATDHCPQHHLALAIAQALGAKITGVILRECRGKRAVLGVMQLEGTDGFVDLDVDLAAALAMAFHLGLPIHMDGEDMLAEGRLLAIQGSADSPASAQIPQAFREVIEGLDMSSYGEEANG